MTAIDWTLLIVGAFFVTLQATLLIAGVLRGGRVSLIPGWLALACFLGVVWL